MTTAAAPTYSYDRPALSAHRASTEVGRLGDLLGFDHAQLRADWIPGFTDPYPDPGYYANCAQIGRVGFDCTGLTLYAAYKGTGIASLSHGPSQATTGGGQVIGSSSALLPGDIVYFDYNASHGLNDIDHAGVYVGGGKVLSAASEKYGIVTESIGWYESGGLQFVGAVRFWH